MKTSDNRKVVQADSRGRVALGSKRAGQFFILQELSDPAEIRLQRGFVRNEITGEVYETL